MFPFLPQSLSFPVIVLFIGYLMSWWSLWLQDTCGMRADIHGPSGPHTRTWGAVSMCQSPAFPIYYPGPTGEKGSSGCWAAVGKQAGRIYQGSEEVAIGGSTQEQSLQTPDTCFIVPLDFTHKTQMQRLTIGFSRWQAVNPREMPLSEHVVLYSCPGPTSRKLATAVSEGRERAAVDNVGSMIF